MRRVLIGFVASVTFLALGAALGMAQTSDQNPAEMSTESKAKTSGETGGADSGILPENFLPLSPGALVLIGDDVDDWFEGNSFLIDGDDVNLDGTPGPGPAALGIATTSPLTAQELIGEANQEGVAALVKGIGSALPNIEALPPDFGVAEFLDSFAQVADMSYEGKPGEYFFFGMPLVWGTREAPKVVYIRDDVNVFGSLEGVGILIVEDQLDINGSFRWEGVVVIGEGGFFNHSLNLTGGVGEIYGAVVAMVEPGQPEIEIAGNLLIQYSRQALENLPGGDFPGPVRTLRESVAPSRSYCPSGDLVVPG